MNLEDKRKLLEQKKARLQKSQALLKAQERKQKLSKKIRIGEIAEKAGFLNLEESVFYGALLSLQKHLADEKFLAKWYEEGKKFIDSKTSPKEIGVPLSISFPSPPPPDLIKTLQAHKFKWNPIRGVWEGRGIKEKINIFISEHNGIINEI